jgi:hypothetical protein
MRQRVGRQIGERRRRGVHWIDGECSISPRYWMFSGEKFHQPCGDLSERKEGEWRRMAGATCRRGRSSVKAGNKGI